MQPHFSEAYRVLYSLLCQTFLCKSLLQVNQAVSQNKSYISLCRERITGAFYEYRTHYIW